MAQTGEIAQLGKCLPESMYMSLFSESMLKKKKFQDLIPQSAHLCYPEWRHLRRSHWTLSRLARVQVSAPTHTQSSRYSLAHAWLD